MLSGYRILGQLQEDSPDDGETGEDLPVEAEEEGPADEGIDAQSRAFLEEAADYEQYLDSLDDMPRGDGGGYDSYDPSGYDPSMIPDYGVPPQGGGNWNDFQIAQQPAPPQPSPEPTPAPSPPAYTPPPSQPRVQQQAPAVQPRLQPSGRTPAVAARSAGSFTAPAGSATTTRSVLQRAPSVQPRSFGFAGGGGYLSRGMIGLGAIFVIGAVLYEVLHG